MDEEGDEKFDYCLFSRAQPVRRTAPPDDKNCDVAKG